MTRRLTPRSLPSTGKPRLFYPQILRKSLEKKLLLSTHIGLEALIEEAEGLGNVEAIAMSCGRLEALILGFGDLSASMGMRYGHEVSPDYQYPGDLWHAHRVRLIAACRAAGIDAIDGPFGNFRDDDGYRRQATYATTLGSVGKWCIHPSQIAHANEIFAPTQKEIETAQQMVAAYQKSLVSGDGAGGEGGMLVDAATLRLFEPVLERARKIGIE